MNARRLNFALLASFLATVFAVSLVGAVFHFVNGGRPTPDQALAELRLAADTSLADRLRRLTEQGDAPAVELLVRALAHERAALRRAAREVIGERLDRWSLLSRPEASQRAALAATPRKEALEGLLRTPQRRRELAKALEQSRVPREWLTDLQLKRLEEP